MNINDRVEILKYTTYLLLRCGFQASQIGYRYLREAVLIACFDEEVVTSVTKLLYPEIARNTLNMYALLKPKICFCLQIMTLPILVRKLVFPTAVI